MSEDNQENGAANGDVPEIELIIKDEIESIDSHESDDSKSTVLEQPILSLALSSVAEQPLPQVVLPQPPLPAVPPDGLENDQYTIFELKCDNPPMYNYVISHAKNPPSDVLNPSQVLPSNNADDAIEEKPTPAQMPYVISVQIPEENVEEQPINKDHYKKRKSKKNSTQTRKSLALKKLTEAVDAVVNKEMTISKAAKAFAVTKSTLWREVNKHTNHRKKKVDEDLNKTIVTRICAGESLSAISRSLKVAKSTIHLHKSRLAQKGQLPAHVTIKPSVDPKEQLAMKDRIIQAFRGIRVNGMSMRFAAKFFQIPPSTLWNHVRRFQAAQAQRAQLSNNEPGVEKENTYDDATTESSVEDESQDEDDGDEESVGTNDEVLSNDFDLIDTYCDALNPESEDGDFLVSFDFETFEEFVKREFD